MLADKPLSQTHTCMFNSKCIINTVYFLQVIKFFSSSQCFQSNVHLYILLSVHSKLPPGTSLCVFMVLLITLQFSLYWCIITSSTNASREVQCVNLNWIDNTYFMSIRRVTHTETTSTKCNPPASSASRECLILF